MESLLREQVVATSLMSSLIKIVKQSKDTILQKSMLGELFRWLQENKPKQERPIHSRNHSVIGVKSKPLKQSMFQIKEFSAKDYFTSRRQTAEVHSTLP